MINYRWLGFVALTGMLAGCSGIKVYPNQFEKNVDVTATTKADSIFARVRASLDIYSVDAHCQPTYEGTVDLGQATTGVGLPVNRPSLLAVRFDSHNYLARSSGTTDDETFLTPRPGYRYRIEARYIDDIYDVKVLERPGRIAKWHAMNSSSARACKGSSATQR